MTHHSSLSSTEKYMIYKIMSIKYTSPGIVLKSQFLKNKVSSNTSFDPSSRKGIIIYESTNTTAKQSF